MAELTCKDGTIIKISDETETELRKAFGPPRYKDSALRVFVTENTSWPITISIARDCTGGKDEITRSVAGIELFISALQKVVTYCKQHRIG